VTRIKTRYRKFATGGFVQPEPSAAPIAPDMVMSIDTDAAPQSHSDDASVALQRQIDALRHSEQIQSQRVSEAQQVAQVQAFIAEHPAMLENPGLLKLAAHAVGNEGHGLEPHSREFFERVKNNFEKRIERFNAPDDLSPSTEPTPKFFEVPKPKVRGNPSMYSAPVSREVPGSNYQSSPSRITLTVEQKDMARRLGQTELEYGLGLLDLQRKKSEGFYDR
jgi:hypothetical protein